MNIKDLFNNAENGTLTYEQFEAAAKASEAKFADLSEGKYVSKSKYDSDLKAKDTQMESLNGQIENLNKTIATRDADLSGLQSQLEEAGQDATKLADITAQFASLQKKYDDDTQSYQTQMKQQAYEFAVREFASTKNFTSQAAKRDFTKAMIDRQLQMEGDKLIGGEDFVELYSADNADAFAVATPEPEPTPTPAPVPTIVAPTSGPADGGNNNVFDFNFTGVREHK